MHCRAQGNLSQRGAAVQRWDGGLSSHAMGGSTGAACLRVVDLLSCTPRSVVTVACRSQRLRSAENRAMLTGAVSGSSGPIMDT